MRLIRENLNEDFINESGGDRIDAITLARFIEFELNALDKTYIVNCGMYIDGKVPQYKEILNDVKQTREFFVDYENKALVLNFSI